MTSNMFWFDEPTWIYGRTPLIRASIGLSAHITNSRSHRFTKLRRGLRVFAQKSWLEFRRESESPLSQRLPQMNPRESS